MNLRYRPNRVAVEDRHVSLGCFLKIREHPLLVLWIRMSQNRRNFRSHFAKWVWTRDVWHFFSRWLHKILSHTVAVFFCQQLGLPPLHFAALITD